jgi:hypothetical protein
MHTLSARSSGEGMHLIDTPALTAALGSALPSAEPLAAILLFVAQVQHLDHAEGWTSLAASLA